MLTYVKASKLSMKKKANFFVHINKKERKRRRKKSQLCYKKQKKKSKKAYFASCWAKQTTKEPEAVESNN
jgi:hypothetical protein